MPGGRPLTTRIAAVENLASECLEHDVFHTLCWMIKAEGDDVAVRGAIMGVLPRWGDSAMHMMAIVQALSLPGVRQTALEALDKMAR